MNEDKGLRLIGLALAVLLSGCARGPTPEQVAAAQQGCDAGRMSACMDYQSILQDRLNSRIAQRQGILLQLMRH